MKLFEVGDYYSTNQDPPVPKMTSKGDFPYFEKNVRLNEKNSRTNPVYALSNYSPYQKQNCAN